MPPGPSTVSILGTGLIGASLGLALRRRFPEIEVVGSDPNAAHAKTALARGAVSRLASPAQAAAVGDLVVLAAPLDALPDLLATAAAHARPGALVTDVGSVKASVMAAARARPGLRFVGGHPMAGAAVGGPEQADALLFENAVYVLTPEDPASPPPEALWLVDAVGARVVVMDAERHDRAVAAVSHLPQLLAVALVEAAAEAGDDALALAAGGFRDMTRIAGSPFSTWGPILRDNRGAVLAALDGFQRQLDAVRRAVADDAHALAPAFEHAGQTRASLPSASKGSLAPLADIVVWADDRPGFLHALTGTIAGAGLNVRDAELLRVRSGEIGTFRFGFETAGDADAAVTALGADGYRAERR
ncbi:prephenate dehydrogenase/arogenate dehydrogenase family protein [Rubrivirga sp. IMCC45206]|uniref:prephenate dehydrogenase/arogenate dehydrogenase family protein n=1 Tax=Rubrivirga sp. IMCC45206 TaxID=3391614 RepID=UPI00399022ED